MIDILDFLPRDIILGSFFAVSGSFCLWRWQRRAEMYSSRSEQYTLFSASNNVLSFDVDHYSFMRCVLEDLKGVRDSIKSGKDSEEIGVQPFPTEMKDFLDIDQSIFGLINDTRSLNILSSLCVDGKRIRYHFESIRRIIEPAFMNSASFGKLKEGGPHCNILTDEVMINNFDVMCGLYMDFIVKKLYLLCRFEVIKTLKYHRKRKIKDGSSAIKKVNAASADKAEDTLNKFFESLQNPADDYKKVKEIAFLHWDKVKQSLEQFDAKK